MFEDERTTRIAICGSGILLALIFFLAHLSPLLLIVPVGILFLGLVADPYETHAVWYGILSSLGIFDPSVLSREEQATWTGKRHYFWFGEVGMAAILAGVFAVPLGCCLRTTASLPLAFTGSALIFLILFVFLPKLIQRAMKADTEAVLSAFGKNEQVKRVFWSVFALVVGLVLAGSVDSEIVQKILAAILLGE